ncbi:MAG: putative Ig domain-containing protein [Pseudomonadota bacterium]
MPDGRILVNNPASLNAETNSEYVLSVFGQMRDNNVIMSSTTDITVNVSSLNINAPVLVDSANTQLQSSAGEALNIAINALFTDADSDTLLFSSNNLPAGLTLSDDGVLAGSVSSAASYDFTISVSDSRHQTSQDFTLVVTQEAEQSTHKSSGSTGLFILLMMALWVYFKRAQRTAVFGIKE